MQKVKTPRIPYPLRLQWQLAVVISAATALSGVGFLLLLRQNGFAWRWLAQTSLVLGVVLWKLRNLLALNFHPADTALLKHLGPATWITLLRANLIAGLAGFAGQPFPRADGGLFWFSWMPGVMYILAALLDYVDGYVARVTGHETRLGEVLDTNIDALGLLVASIVAIGYGQLPAYYIAVGAAYYGLNAAVWYRQKTGRPVTSIAPRPGARLVAGIQMGFVGAALLPLFSPSALALAAIILMIPLLAGFVKDWLIICGRMGGGSNQHKAWDTALTRVLPLGLRFAAVLEGSTLFQKGLSSAPTGSDAMDAALPMADAGIWSLLHAVCLAMLAFGVLGRVAALGLSLSSGLIISRVGISLPVGVQFVSALILIMTGTGWASLWQPEESIWTQKLGKRT